MTLNSLSQQKTMKLILATVVVSVLLILLGVRLRRTS